MLEQGRIVTWLDRNSEYADDLDAVQELLDDATLITINANLFETKLRIFAEDTKSRYVLYRAGELPSLEEDLLADVRCGYPTFTADASTLLVRELGVDPALAVVIDEYAPFFKSSARVADLKKHLAGIADADKRSDRKTFLAAMSAVLLKTQQRSFSVLFAKLATASSVDGNDPLKSLKWGLDAYFWEGAYAIWGYDDEHTFDALMTWLFVNNATRRIGLVGYWDVVAFDEFAGRKRVERSLVDTLKNYLANKSFSRGDSTITAEASMVFVGNTTRTVPAMLATADLFEALPEAYHDTAYMDRIHYYLPGWEVDIVRPELFSRGYGLIVDYLAEALRHLRTLDYSGDLDTLATLDPAMSKRDQDAVRKTFSGLAKLIFPARDGAPEELEELLRFAIEGRKRVKDQIIRLDDTMAASGSHFTYMLGRVDQDHYDAARACMVPTQEELDYPQYFTSHSDGDERGSGQRGGEELSDGLPKSDGVVNASGDSRPASPVFDRRALLKARAIPRRYKIEPSMGHSMPGILLPYLFDAAEIQIRDPYLRKPHQIRNVHEILLLLIQHADAARLPRVVIETCASDEDDYRAKQEATFEQLQQSWGQFGIVIDWSIVDDFHDRSIVTDTGWVIDLGRGLDVYESFTWSSPFDPRITLPHLRRTKEITINVSRDTEGHA